TVTATDTVGATSTGTRFVTVADDDPNPPTIVLGGSGGVEDASVAQKNFSWNVTDFSNLSALSVVISKDTGSGPVSIYSSTDLANTTGTFNLDGSGFGVFTITVTASDADVDQSGDVATATQSRAVSVIVAQPSASASGPMTATEGQQVTLHGSF